MNRRQAVVTALTCIVAGVLSFIVDPWWLVLAVVVSVSLPLLTLAGRSERTGRG
ncbi:MULTISPECIES: hypothetical protein [unclassified Pseudactinotalea]|uniref:hypothetical protein n=1 Tax=unclassified Pseudactinotalea TaxID=2649176 RepID=UPI00129CAFEC|nr:MULTISPECIES: hypothetical protein [unclassified Pseudactinotalea]QGH69925.1 hypothetical protein GCE65_10720 [Pseudactinotalea sp. HY158]